MIIMKTALVALATVECNVSFRSSRDLNVFFFCRVSYIRKTINQIAVYAFRFKVSNNVQHVCLTIRYAND